MADEIRGLSVKISADTKEFNKSFSEMKKGTNSMKQEIDALTKSLEMDFDSKKLERAQQKCQSALDQTANQAEVLKKRLEHLEKGDNVNTSEYKKLEAELAKTELTAQQLEKQLKKLNSMDFSQALGNKFQAVGNGITSVGKKLSVASGIAVGAGAALSKIGLDAVSSADDIATLASKYNITATELQRLQYIALQTDVSNESLYKGLIKTRAAVADLSTGIENNASKALSQLGVNLSGLSEGEQFNVIISSLADMEDKTQMVAVANEIFGDKLANEILPLIYSGSDAIKEYSSEFESLGALTDEQVSALATFDNVMNKIKTQLANVALQIGSSLLPLMQSIADVISDSVVPKLQALAAWFNSLSESQQNFMAKALLITAALGPVVLIIGKLTSGVGGLIKKIPALMSGLSALSAHPIIAIIGVVAGIIAVLYTQNEQFRESINNLVATLGGALQPILELLMSILQPVTELIAMLAETLGVVLTPVIDILNIVLTNIINRFSFIMNLLQPLIKIALIPLQLQFKAISSVLQLLAPVINLIGGLLEGLGNIATSIMSAVINVINGILETVSDGINWLIDKVNWVIDKLNMIPGVNIDKIDSVDLRIGGVINDGEIEQAASNATSGKTTASIDFVYDKINTAGVNNSTASYDYSTSNTTQNINITIENYSAELDIPSTLDKINIALAEAM